MVEGGREGNREADGRSAEREAEQADDNVRFVGGTWEIRDIPDKGYGLFILEDLSEGECICSCPALEIPEDELGGILDKYVFMEEGEAFLALGILSYLNHSNKANCEAAVWRLEDGRPFVEAIAHRDIEAGEELTINYNGDPDDPTEWEFDTPEENQ